MKSRTWKPIILYLKEHHRAENKNERKSKINKKNITYKEIAESFLQLVASGQVREAYESYIGPDFCHHNPFFPGDAESLMIAMEESAAENPHKTLDIKHSIEENNMVVVHSHVKQNSNDLEGAVVHIFRFQNEKIVEFWDIGQSIPENFPNKNGMF